MADEPSAQEVDLGNEADHIVAAIAKVYSTDVVSHMISGAIVDAVAGIVDKSLKAVDKTAQKTGEAFVALERPILPLFAALISPIVSELFGTNAGVEAFKDRANRSGRQEAAVGIVDAYMAAMGGDGSGEIEPGDEGAKKLAGAAVHAAIEGWFNGIIPEILGDMIPINWLHFEHFTELSEDIIRVLGVGRLVRRALSPLVDVTAATPMKWKVNQAFRPTTLGASTVAKQLARGRWTYDQAYTELTKEGYSDERIEALLNEQDKFLSPSELDVLVRAGQYTRAEALAHLQDQGYSDVIADLKLKLESASRIASFERAMADAAMAAYTDGRIDGGTLDAFTHGTTIDAEYGNQLRELAQARRTLRAQPLSPAEAKSLVLDGILAVSDYRLALQQAGRTSDAVDALELQLRKQLDDKLTLDEHRAQQAADKAAADAARAEKLAAKQAEIDAQRALARRGPISELTRAVVRGIVPIARLEEVLNADFDADTVAIYVADVEQQRQDYMDQQAKAEAAAKRATGKTLSVGELSDALMADVLTLDQVGAQLANSGLAAADVDVLVSTLRAKKADRDAAVKQRADAAAKAAIKSIDLGRFEQLVRAGHRTLQQYADLLQSLGYDDAGRAAMGELLQVHIAADIKAGKLRGDLSAANPAKGLTLDQFRRAVILGVKSIDDWQTFLVSEGYTTDAQIVLTAELRDDVASADAARRTRTTTGALSGSRALPLATIAKAARLGIVPVSLYQSRLIEVGYSDDDVAIELDLLTAEMSSVAAARTLQNASAGASAPSGLTLSQLAHAVKLGEASIDDYRARVAALGYGSADMAVLVAVLQDEVDTLAAADARHSTIDGQLATRNLSLSEFESAVKNGFKSLDDYQAWLVGLGYAVDDAELLRALLALKLPGA